MELLTKYGLGHLGDVAFQPGQLSNNWSQLALGSFRMLDQGGLFSLKGSLFCFKSRLDFLQFCK